jgi:hypothetical protein
MRKTETANKINKFSYFSPSFDLKTRVVTLPQSITGVLLTLFSVLLVVLTVIEGIDNYLDVEKIAVTSTTSYNRATKRFNLAENDFYPIAKVKLYSDTGFYTSAQV